MSPKRMIKVIKRSEREHGVMPEQSVEQPKRADEARKVSGNRERRESHHRRVGR